MISRSDGPRLEARDCLVHAVVDNPVGNPVFIHNLEPIVETVEKPNRFYTPFPRKTNQSDLASGRCFPYSLEV